MHQNTQKRDDRERDDEGGGEGTGQEGGAPASEGEDAALSGGDPEESEAGQNDVDRTSVESALGTAGLVNLKGPLPPERLEALLEALAEVASTCPGLRGLVLREEAIRRLKGAGVLSPAAVVDAALGPSTSDIEDSQEQGHEIEFEELAPWPDKVEGPSLYAELAGVLRRFLVIAEEALLACVLWVLHTYTWRVAEYSPRLGITAPTARAGKSRLLEVLAGLVARPLTVDGITAAALVRCIELWGPTTLMDEADALSPEAWEAMRGVINGGQRPGKKMVKCVGDGYRPKAFNVFGPLAIARIGALTGTVGDRAIHVQMRRKRRDEKKDRLKISRYFKDMCDLRRRIVRWAQDHMRALRGADPALPEALDDRAADGWEPLLAIADEIGGDCPQAARLAAVALTSARDSRVPEEIEAALLRDVRYLFKDAEEERLSSGSIVEGLATMTDRPWGAWGKPPKPITPRDLAALLRPFSIVPVSKRLPDGRILKGYERAAFEDAFARYLVPEDA